MLGLGIGLGPRRPVAVGDMLPPPEASTIGSWAEMRALNDAALSALPSNLGADITAWGDSLTQGAANGNTGSASWVPELATYFTNDIHNEGGGGQTSDEILARITAASVDQLDDVSIVMWGTNNGVGGSYEAPAIIADFDAADPVFTGAHVFVGGFQTLPYGRSAGNGVSSKDVWHHLRNAYPDQSISLWAAMSREIVDDPTAEPALLAGNFEPLQISSGNLHWADARGLEKDAARSLAAVATVGPPFVCEEETPARYVVGAPAGRVIHRFRRLGQATGWQIVGGNDDGAFALTPAGELITTATPFLDDFREVFVAATNANGRHYGRILVGRAAADGDYSQATRCRIETGGYYHHGETTPRAFSIAMRVRHIAAGRYFLSGSCVFKSTSAGGFDGFFRATDGSQQFAPRINPGPGWHWIMASWRMDAGVAENGLITYGSDGTVNSRVPTTTAALQLDEYSTLLTNGTSFSIAADADMRGLWIAHEFVDWSDQNLRDQLFDPDTFDPVLAGDGLLAGIAPQIWVYGGPGDWASGHNRGSQNLHMVPTVDVARARYERATP